MPAPERKAAADINSLIEEIRIKGRNAESIAHTKCNLTVFLLRMSLRGGTTKQSQVKNLIENRDCFAALAMTRGCPRNDQHASLSLRGGPPDRTGRHDEAIPS